MTNASVFNERAPKLINGLRGLAATERRRSDIVMQRVTWNHLLSAGRAAGTQYLNRNFSFRVERGCVVGGVGILTIITKIQRLAKSENRLKLKGRQRNSRSKKTLPLKTTPKPEPNPTVKYRSFPHSLEVQKGLSWSANTAEHTGCS